jgi:hypothetical protein
LVLFFAVNSDRVAGEIDSILNPSRLSASRVDEASSEYYRIALFQAVVDRLAGYQWLIGAGQGTFHIADVEARYDDSDHVLTAPDGHYTKVLFEDGMLGLLLMGILLAKCISLCVRAFRMAATLKDRLAVLSAIVGVTGFVLINITVSMYLVFPLSMLFWCAVAFSGTVFRRSVEVNGGSLALRTELPNGLAAAPLAIE